MKNLKKYIKNPILRIIASAVLLLAAILLEHFDLPIFAIIIYIFALLVAGLDVFINAVRGIIRRDLLDEKFLMSIAAIGAMILGEYNEGVAVMLFFLIGETFEKMAVRRSRNSIKALMEICPDEATVIIDGEEETVDAEDVEVGATILIRAGERVPLDCEIISGSTDIDTSSMTGEALPRSVSAGDTLDSGVMVISGVITCRVLRPLTESAASRVLALVENATENKSKEENFITKFSHYYTPIVVALAVLLAFIPPIFRILTIGESVKRALTFLVISCPCALVISVPMAFFGGIGAAASRGILYKGGNVFSKVAKMSTVAFDKTGTLTSGEFAITEINPIGVSADELIRLAASAEYGSNHPLALAIRASAEECHQPTNTREIAGEGIIATVLGSEIAVGNGKLMIRLGITKLCEGSVYVAKNGVLLGSLTLGDKIKSESRSAISRIKALGVKKCVILSGDRAENVEKIISELSLDEAFAELKPEDKYSKLEELIASAEGSVGYVGDGINDAPTLARADVGFAMGAIGSDSAVEAADAVIMSDNLDKIAESIIIARKTISISWQNIIFAIGIKVLVMILGALGFANMWLAVFADVGVSVLAILNSMRTLRYKE
ncbi:MAG: cadmium-translocating P-type ATPase [Clostridia bacterium]|nr:cadmium-translocating P-type ATPase [Clostridia bacterium]